MSILQGNTYKLPIIISDCGGNVVMPDNVKKASFTFGDINKKYDGEDGEVYFDYDKNAWVLPLSEEETFALNRVVKWQARFYFNDGSIDGTDPKSVNVYDSIDQTRFTGGVEDA